MYKRALLLTAATVALLSGTAFAADPNNTDIKTKVTTPVATSTADSGAPGNILIETDGSVVTPGPTGSNPVVPAVTIDSSNIVTNQGTISFTGVTNAIGVQLNSGNAGGPISGALDSTGTIDLTGSGTDKIGILITTPTGITSTTFTGVPLPGAVTPVTTPTAIDLEAGSILKIQGDSSVGIELASGTTLAGDILVGGSMTVAPTTAGETSGVGGTGIELLGTMNGNLTVETGGSIITTGPGAQGVLVTGALNGTFSNFGSIEALGTGTASATQTNAASGDALLINNNISGGIYNAGSDISNPSTSPATILSAGALPTILIAPAAAATGPVDIGTVTDPDGIAADAGFSILNRGSIQANPANPDTDTTAIRLVGASSTIDVVLGSTNGGGVNTLSNGIFNSGSIVSVATNDTKQGATTQATGILIDNYAFVQKIDNSNASGSGTISATLSGSNTGVATAIAINADGSLTEIDNSGTITASASTTDTTIDTLNAYAIRDLSGTLTTIDNTGTISATATALDDSFQIARAADLSTALNSITFTNNGTVVGDVLFGAHNDTFSVVGLTSTTAASMTGNINFGGGTDTLTIGGNNAPDSVTGKVQEQAGGMVAVTINTGASLFLKNDGILTNQTDVTDPASITANLPVSSMTVDNDATLGLTLSNAFNTQNAQFVNEAIVASTTGTIDLVSGAVFKPTYGSFISASNTSPAQFVLLEAPAGMLVIGNEGQIATDIVGSTEVPFLYTGSVCTWNVAGSPNPCTGTEPLSTTDGELILDLAPKSAATLGLTGYALKMFPYANAALANDNALGAAVIAAGVNLPGTTPAEVTAAGQALYQQIYSSFAPDVTGAVRAEAISLTDQATGPVGARQRALRMYAGQDGDATLWGQEFAQRLQVGNQITAGGYDDSGFGFALGMDAGDPADGRYGAAFTFFSGDADEKSPRDTKTSSQWYMLTGYSDWRGKGFFFDSQINAGYGSLDGKRFFDFGGVSREANGQRAAALASGGATAGVALTAGGTVLMPQISVDALTMREESYTESNDGATTSQADDGFDLHVHQDYAQSLRGFIGADLRQDLNLGDFFLQPEARVGYRYDFVDGAETLKAEFASVPNSTFSITGPDPARGNAVAGFSLATTTGAWSIGLNYDYLLGVGSPNAKDTISQSGTITLVGRI